MAKYIIDIPDEVPVSDELVPFDICRPSWYWEAYEKGRADAEDEVWEFAKTVSIMKPEDKRECWGTDKYNTINLGYSYQEAKAQYEAWKAEREQIRVGDEVEYPPNKAKGIVVRCHVPDVYAEVDKYAIFTGASVEYLPIEWLTKTGRVFPEVAELLKKMREE